MPPVGAVSVVVDDRAARRMLGQYTGREMHNRLRRGTRAGGALYRRGIVTYARGRSDIPDFFAKTRTRSSASMRSGIYTSVRPKSGLVSIFESGASAHEIRPTSRTWLLFGPAGQRWRKSEFVARRVRHPGMAPRPILAPVFQTVTPAAKKAVAATVFGDSAVGLLGLDA